jgi:hypothetical protein
MVFSKATPGVSDKGQSHEGGGRPLHWVGYDCSAFAVAKTLVIIGMLSSESTTIPDIIQVWLSAAWSQQALAEF